MDQKWLYFVLVIVTLTISPTTSCACDTFCSDWTICQRVRCAPPPVPCPKNKPYLLYGDCGCCQYCSETPRIGPCGQCGACKESYPICTDENQIVSLDYCGCCRVCKSVIAIGGACATECPSFSVCDAGLRCINGTCAEPATN